MCIGDNCVPGVRNLSQKARENGQRRKKKKGKASFEEGSLLTLGLFTVFSMKILMGRF
jgi:hypothetical protein